MTTKLIESHIAAARKRIELLKKLAALEAEEAKLRASVKAHVPRSNFTPEIEAVKTAVAEFYNMDVEALEMPHNCPGAKKSEYAWPRQVAMMLAYDLTGASLTIVGAAFDRDTTSVTHACKAVKDVCSTSSTTRLEISEVRARVEKRLAHLSPST